MLNQTLDHVPHFHVLDVFKIPHYVLLNNEFVTTTPSKLLEEPLRKAELWKNRYELIKQRIVRTEMGKVIYYLYLNSNLSN